MSYRRVGFGVQARWRALGNMQFVGYLYKHRLIAEKIMHECIRALLEDVSFLFCLINCVFFKKFLW